MPKISAGILMYRHGNAGIEVLLVHPGGPFWRNRDLGAWSIPKGEFLEGENPEAVARREFAEELGVELTGPLQPLGQLRQRGGKTVIGYAAKGALDVANVRSNQVPIEWPLERAALSTFPRLIAPNGSTFPSPAKRFSPANNRFSTG